jgi:fructose-bisphosphate aldolase class I
MYSIKIFIKEFDMNKEQFNRMKNGNGFIAALDQSGGSTPKALANYGITKDEYNSEDEMFDLVHKMRSRIITSPSFSSKHILGAILFEKTMDSKIDGLYSGDYLWQKKGIIPILKVDCGKEELKDGVQLMKPIVDLESKIERAKEKNIFGTKMRSVIISANEEGIKNIVKQQFYYGKKIHEQGLIPILEPEVDIKSKEKLECEKILKDEILKNLAKLDNGEMFMFKLTLPEIKDFYQEVINNEHVVRVVALSGGYSREEAVSRLADNHGMIASFSRAFLEGLTVDQDDNEFDEILAKSSKMIYDASMK